MGVPIEGRDFDGRFEVLDFIGQGAMGVMYRALDRQTGEQVAVKMLWHGTGPDERRFERESYILAQRPPLLAPDALAALAKILHEPADPLRALRADVLWLQAAGAVATVHANSADTADLEGLGEDRARGVRSNLHGRHVPDVARVGVRRARRPAFA